MGPVATKTNFTLGWALATFNTCATAADVFMFRNSRFFPDLTSVHNALVSEADLEDELVAVFVLFEEGVLEVGFLSSASGFRIRSNEDVWLVTAANSKPSV